MSEKYVKIDENKCVHCGQCVKDCIVYALEMGESNTPKYAQNGEERCIKCQHCFSICPTGAISFGDKNSDEASSIESVDSEKLLNLIKSRRSYRQYKKENLSIETFGKLKDMLNWVPTGCNFHKLHFAFVEDVEVMDKIRTHVNNKLIDFMRKFPVHKLTKKFSCYYDALVNGEDVIFRDAPHMVVVSAPINAPCANIDPIIALSYFDLYAQSLDIGTCWCGFAEICMQMFPELAKEMKIPEGYKAYYVMLFGPKGVNYSRTTIPESFEFTTVDSFAPQRVGLVHKLKHFVINFLR